MKRIAQASVALADTASVSHASAPLRRAGTGSICLFCQQSTRGPQDERPNQRRHISTTPRRSRESIAPQTHYEFFPRSIPEGPPPTGRFAVDLRNLRNEFLRLQAEAHPDRHPPETKRRAEALSARINEAYKTLQDPLRRAQYLLSLRGIDLAEDETAKVEDPELLMEVLEARELIEEAEEEHHLDELREANDERIQTSIAILEEAFKADDVETAKSEAVKLRYWINIKESIEAWEKGKPVVLVH